MAWRVTLRRTACPPPVMAVDPAPELNDRELAVLATVHSLCSSCPCLPLQSLFLSNWQIRVSTCLSSQTLRMVRTLSQGHGMCKSASPLHAVPLASAPLHQSSRSCQHLGARISASPDLVNAFLNPTFSGSLSLGPPPLPRFGVLWKLTLRSLTSQTSEASRCFAVLRYMRLNDVIQLYTIRAIRRHQRSTPWGSTPLNPGA